MPIIGILLGGVNFSSLSVSVGGAKIMYGTVIQATVDFLLIALFLFLVIKSFNKLAKEPEQKEETPTPTEAELLAEIRDLLKNK